MNNTRNGNGKQLTKRTHQIENLPSTEIMELPPWLKSLREAMGESVSAADLKEIMKAQIEKAKEGNHKSADFVFRQAHKIIEANKRNVSITQNNYFGADEADRPDIPLEPGDDEHGHLRKLQARVQARQPTVGNIADRRFHPVSDEDEKELRRQEESKALKGVPAQ